VGRDKSSALVSVSAGARRTAVAGAVLLLGACGGTSTSSSSTTIDPRNPTQVATDRAAAASTVLKVDDFPAGWTAQANADSTARSAEQRSAEAQFAECADVDPSVIGGGDTSPTRAKSDEFSDGSDHQVDNSATVVATIELGRQQLDSIRKPAVPGCLATFVNRAIQSALKNPNPGQAPASDVTFGEAKVVTLDLSGLHAPSVGYRATVPVRIGDRSADVTLDLVLALTGRTGISMTFTSFGAPLDNALEVGLTNKVIDRAAPA
jgi:hypothetical protein